MGGSAIGGDLLAGLVELEHAPPVQVIRGYQLPSWIGPDTLVIASSYSGNTEETLSAYREACLRGACLVAMTSGVKSGRPTGTGCQSRGAGRPCPNTGGNR